MLDCKIGDLLLNTDTEFKFKVTQIFTGPIYYCESIGAKKHYTGLTIIEVIYPHSTNYRKLSIFDDELEDL